MAEPLDPAVAGVASLLKSLRTRAGLREGRLSGTELTLDTLTGLDRVRELIAAGDSPERAIVRAVRTAASTLEPTMSIVADVSLCLKLSADGGPDPDLYASDLRRRRAALLTNWERLHQLRSVPPADKPAPRTLRLEVEAAALSALAMALTDATTRGRIPGPDGGTCRARHSSDAANRASLLGRVCRNARIRHRADQVASSSSPYSRGNCKRTVPHPNRRRAMGRGEGSPVRHRGQGT